MLAGMSNLAELANTGHAKAPEFNAIFYATVATIIPVLFVAAALQEDMYAKLIEISRAANRRFRASKVLLETLSAYIIFLVTFFVPLIIIFFGVVSEIMALVELYLQRTIDLPGPFLNGAISPLIATTGLTVAAAIGPATKFGTLIYEVVGSFQPSKTTETSPEEEPREHRTATGEPPPPESGEPGGDQPHKS
jgi:hypothetical protein